MIRVLRQYQRQIWNAVLDSVLCGRGLTFTVEIARQGGKNELSSGLEVALLVMNGGESKNLIKCSPTFRPQAVISMTRLKDRLDEAFPGQWSTELGYIVKVGGSRAIFLSADESARVVGHTAHLLLEIDEAQDVNKDKYGKEFRPMGATTNATTVLYGTAWDDTTLLEEARQTNLELERKDGIRRHFSFDWQEVAKHNPDYLRYVESERQRLGENHPLFRTQYCLLSVRGGGGFLSSVQRDQLQGDHPRLRHCQPDRIYVASIDLAGEAETEDGMFMTSLRPRRDSTVVTIGELEIVGYQVMRRAEKDPIPAHAGIQNQAVIPPSGFPIRSGMVTTYPLMDGSPEQVSPFAKGGRVGVRGICSPERAYGHTPLRQDGINPSTIHTPEQVSLFRKEGPREICPSQSRTAFQNHPAKIPLGLPFPKGEDGSPLDVEQPGSPPLLKVGRKRDFCSVRVVQHYAWTGRRHTELYPQLVDLLKNVWHCKRIVVDATGVGQPVYSFLRQALGSAVSSFVFTAPSKSGLGFNLLAAINSGMLKMYAGDGSGEYQEFWSQMEKARSFYRPSQTMNFYVDPSHGHDDYLMSLALLVEAASLYEPRVAKGR